MTGTASSYARKYALNGLFAIDDTKDADTDEFHNESKQAQKKSPKPEAKPEYTAKQVAANRDEWIKLFNSGNIIPDDLINEITKIYSLSDDLRQEIENLGAPF